MDQAVQTNTWQKARLIPTSGISGAEEQEGRATSALLAVLTSVKEFGAAIVRPLGAPAGTLEAFIEVEFPLGERKVRPDGLIRITRGQRQWTALVEVKTGANPLERAQVEDYLDVARENTFDAVLTISNQIASAPGVHPVEVDKRKIRKVALVHLSWTEIVSIAVVQQEHRGVSDADQAWVLGELIRYLEHPKSGALSFTDMGQAWPTVRESAVAHTLRASDKGINDVVARWEQLLTFIALRMERSLGAQVRVVRSRRDAADPSARLANAVALLAKDGRLEGTIRVPGAIGDLEVSVDVRAQRVNVTVEAAAPREGRATTRVNWLLRQLSSAPDGIRVDAFAAFARTSRSELLRDARNAPEKLAGDSKEELKSFRLTATSPMGTNRASGRNGFIDSVVGGVESFYQDVVQGLRPWVPKAPQLRFKDTDGDADRGEELVVGTADGIASGAEQQAAWVGDPRSQITHSRDGHNAYTIELSDGEELRVTADDLDDAGRIAETELALPDGVEPVSVAGLDGERELGSDPDPTSNFEGDE